MQPYLFPYIGSFSLVAATDVYVFFDNVQYIRRGWMHRNRVHRPGGGWQYLGVPITRAPRSARIHEVRLSTAVDWRDRLRATLTAAYRGCAPRFEQTMALVEAGIAPPVTHLADLNMRTFALCCAELGLELRPTRATDMTLTRPDDAPVAWWATAACQAMGATHYINPPGGAALYPPEAFSAADLHLGILRPRLAPYDRGDLGWEAGLSVLDALMFLAPADVRALVAAHEVDWQTPEAG